MSLAARLERLVSDERFGKFLERESNVGDARGASATPGFRIFSEKL
jgi:hypothetical protein